MRIAVLLGSTREGRKGAAVADWVLRRAAGRGPTYELVDLADQGLPHLAEPVPPMVGRYSGEPTVAWSRLINGFDAFVIVTPEYNHGIPGVLKNALDHLFAEWSGKPVGLVGYGVNGGVRALDQLRVLTGVLGMADVQPQTELTLGDALTSHGVAATGPHVEALDATLLAVEAWAEALRPGPVSVGQDRP